MEQRIFFALLSIVLFSSTALNAQQWKIDGNKLTKNSTLGSTNNFDLIFETNNKERGRITRKGLWGIGTKEPAAKLDVNGASGQTGFVVRFDETPKFAVTNRGVAAGRLFTDSLNIGGSLDTDPGFPAAKLHVLSGPDVSPDGGGFIVSGLIDFLNIAIDNNEIMARNNGAASGLTLNNNGGNVVINGTNAPASNVGISTSNPTADLHIVHSINNGFFVNGLRLENEGSNQRDWLLYTQNSDGFLQLFSNAFLKGQFSSVTGRYSALSDIRRKKDIEKAPDLLDKVLKLDVKKYRMLKSAASEKKYYGLIAQEVEKIFPEVVSHNIQDDGSDIYMLDYSAFGVLAIKALQEQQQKITALEKDVAALKTALFSISSDKEIQGNSDIINASLEQNQPNPFDQTSIIHYKIPEKADAQIMISDASGKLVKTMQVTQSGQTQIDAFNLEAGTYIYSLMINGKVAASKKMVVMK